MQIGTNVRNVRGDEMSDFVISTAQYDDMIDELVITDCALPPVEVLRMYADYTRKFMNTELSEK